jgi:hypothetical protein
MYLLAVVQIVAVSGGSEWRPVGIAIAVYTIGTSLSTFISIGPTALVVWDVTMLRLHNIHLL